MTDVNLQAYNDVVMDQVGTLCRQLTEAAGAMFLGRTVRWERYDDFYGRCTGEWVQGEVVGVSWHFDGKGLYFRVREQQEGVFVTEVTLAAKRCVLVTPSAAGSQP